MFVTCPPVGTAVDTDPDGARVIGMLTGDLLGTNGLWRVYSLQGALSHYKVITQEWASHWIQLSGLITWDAFSGAYHVKNSVEFRFVFLHHSHKW